MESDNRLAVAGGEKGIPSGSREAAWQGTGSRGPRRRLVRGGGGGGGGFWVACQREWGGREGAGGCGGRGGREGVGDQ